MRRNFGYDDLGALFNLRKPEAYNIFWNMSFLDFELDKNWPKRLALDNLKEGDMNKLFEEARKQDPLFQELANNVKDPLGKGKYLVFSL